MLTLYFVTGAVLGAINMRSVLAHIRGGWMPYGLTPVLGVAAAFLSWLLAWPVLGVIECGAMLLGDGDDA
jgi:hypothetical protein